MQTAGPVTTEQQTPDTTDEPLVVRAANLPGDGTGDESYIYQTWLGDLREADDSFLPNDLWFPAHREVIRRVLSHPSTQTLVLCDPLAPDNIFGYVVRDPAFLHWIHIRRGTKWRNRGLAKHLLLKTHSHSLPLIWRTKLGHEKLLNPRRSRLARHAWWSTGPSTAASSTSSSPT